MVATRAITPPARALDARVRPPGSKSLTNRALVVAALARGTSKLTGALDSDDTRVMAAALRALGLAADLTAVTGCARRGAARAGRAPGGKRGHRRPLPAAAAGARRRAVRTRRRAAHARAAARPAARRRSWRWARTSSPSGRPGTSRSGSPAAGSGATVEVSGDDLQPVPQRPAAERARLPGRPARDGPRTAGLPTVRRHDAGRDAGLRGGAARRRGDGFSRGADGLCRAGLRDRARRVGGVLLLRRGGDHRRAGGRRRAGPRLAPGRPALRRHPRADGLSRAGDRHRDRGGRARAR